MTGFGEAAEQVGEVHYSVELRSLNNRYFKASVRLPEDIQALEAELDALLRKRLTRGSVTLTCQVHLSGEAGALDVNDAALLKYVRHLETIQQRLDGSGRAISIDLTQMLALPGVLQSADEENKIAAARPVLTRLAAAACDKLIRMRQAEGDSIAQDIRQQGEIIRGHLQRIAGRAPEVVEEYHTRLRSRIDELLARAQLEVDQVDLIREIGVFAERADINEELSRMDGHLEQLGQLISADEPRPIGRTLDFLAQEMLREANTIGSKSNDAMINRAVVEVKGAIDRIKEQAQNVE